MPRQNPCWPRSICWTRWMGARSQCSGICSNWVPMKNRDTNLWGCVPRRSPNYWSPWVRAAGRDEAPQHLGVRGIGSDRGLAYQEPDIRRRCAHQRFSRFAHGSHHGLAGAELVRQIALSLSLAGLAFMMTAIWGGPLLRILRHFNIGKIIRVDEPGHHGTKMGTPTLGGVMFILP